MTPLKKGQQSIHFLKRRGRKKKSTHLYFPYHYFCPVFIIFRLYSEYFFSQEELYLHQPEMFKELFSMKLAVEDLQ